MACRKRCWLREAGCGCLLADCWPAGGRHLLSSGMACRDYGGAVAGGSQGPSVNSWVRASRGSMPHLAASPGVLSPLHDVAVKRFTESFCNTSAKCGARCRRCSEPCRRGPATCATPLTIVGDELTPLRPARFAETHAMPVLHPERRSGTRHSAKTPPPAAPAADPPTWPPSAPPSSRPSKTPATCTSRRPPRPHHPRRNPPPPRPRLDRNGTFTEHAGALAKIPGRNKDPRN